MSFFFQDFFGGGMPGGHGHMHGEDEDEGPVDTNKAYEVLGVSKTADENEIKNAYKKKARELHPDRHPVEREKYQKLFQELQHAYDVLKDPEKRRLYDKFGDKGVKQGGGGSASDIFSGMFNKRGEESGPKKSPAIKRVLEVTLEDLYKGAMKEVEIQRSAAGKSTTTCDRCHGNGVITVMQRMGPMMLQQQRECPKCEGQGYELESTMVTVQAHIPVGAKTGEVLTVRGEGHRYPNHAPGDVIFQLRTVKHETFTRQGADLGMNTTLSLREALCGYELRIKHVSGQILIVTPPKGKNEIVQPGSLKRVFTYGMPQRYSPHVKGHLYIVMEVKLPLARSLSTKQIQQLKSALPDQVIEQVNESKDEHEHGDEEMKSNSNRKSGSSKKPSTPSSDDKKNGKSNSKTGESTKKNEDPEETIEVECHDVEGKPQFTPATAKGVHDEDEDEREGGVPCQQM